MATKIRVAVLEAFQSPFENDVWRCGLVTGEMVAEAISHGELYSYQQWKSIRVSPDHEISPEQHAGRIAYLAIHGWDDCISIDVGVPSLGCTPVWPYTDGNHRLCAAIHRGDDFIDAEVEGDIDYAEELFGVPIEDPEEGK